MLLNDKASNKRLCEDCGLPLVKGFIEQPGQDLSETLGRVLDFLKEEGSIIIRASQGSGGSGIGIFHAEASTVASDLRRFFEGNSKQGTFLVEQFLPVADSLNVQVSVENDQLTFIGMSSQLLAEGTKHEGNRGGFCYLGNRIPTEYQEAVEASFTLAHAARDAGYRGILGFDFIVTEAGDVFCIETNARVNGSTLAHKVVHDVAMRHRTEVEDIAWSLVTVETGYDSFADVTRKLSACNFNLLPQDPLEPGQYVIPVENLGQGRWSMLLIDSANPDQITVGSDRLSSCLMPKRPEYYLTKPVRDELVNLYQSAGIVREQRYGFADWATKPESIADWAAACADKTIVLKTRTGDVAGAVSITSEVPGTAPNSVANGVLQISRLAIHPHFEGQGLGSFLLNEAEQYCQQQGHGQVFLYWRGDSPIATAEALGEFYAKRGYEPVATIHVAADAQIAVNRYHHYGVKQLPC
jgi:GNAT superfamily N-acetyltransferase